MPRKPLSPRVIIEILRLRHEQELGIREVGRILDISDATVRKYLDRMEAAGLAWPLPSDLSPDDFYNAVYSKPNPSPTPKRPVPDWISIVESHQHNHVPLRKLWLDYKSEHPDGFAYSWFCESYRRYVDAKLEEPSAFQSSELADPKWLDIETEEMQVVNIPAAILTYSTFSNLDALGEPGRLSWTASNADVVRLIGSELRYRNSENQ